jgi:hypothetical protein
MTRTCRLLLTLPLFLVVVSGCKTSRTPAKVSGKVTYKGEPVPAGSITFHPKEGGGTYPYTLNPDGTYSGSDLPTGEMVVTVETESANPKAHSLEYGGGKGKGAGPNEYMKKMKERGMVPEGPANKGTYVPIPKKYADPKTSDLRADLKKGNNPNDFDLKD